MENREKHFVSKVSLIYITPFRTQLSIADYSFRVISFYRNAGIAEDIFAGKKV